MLQSTIHQDDPTKSCKNFIEHNIGQRMLTQTINFCKFIFFGGVSTLRKFAMSYTLK